MRIRFCSKVKKFKKDVVKVRRRQFRGHEANMMYAEQMREYKLYDNSNTRRRKQQSGFSLVHKGTTIKEILVERNRELEV